MDILEKITVKQEQQREIAARLKDATLPESTYRELVRRNNELIAEVQELELAYKKPTVTPPLSFEL